MKTQAYFSSLLPFLAVGHALAGEPITNAWGPLTNNAQMAISAIPRGRFAFRSKFIIGGGTNTFTGVTNGPVVVKSEFKVGEAFSLLVRVRNLSTNETLTFFCGGAYPNEEVGLACEVISPSGRNIYPKMSPGPEPFTGHAEFPTARPGQTAEFEFPVSGLCNFEEIGTYKITARKKTQAYKKGQNAFVLTSNTLCVSVVPTK